MKNDRNHRPGMWPPFDRRDKWPGWAKYSKKSFRRTANRSLRQGARITLTIIHTDATALTYGAKEKFPVLQEVSNIYDID